MAEAAREIAAALDDFIDGLNEWASQAHRCDRILMRFSTYARMKRAFMTKRGFRRWRGKAKAQMRKERAHG